MRQRLERGEIADINLEGSKITHFNTK